MEISIPDHAIQLFGIACLARNRARESAKRSPDSPQPDASVSVVMAAASAEGFMNELGEVCSPRFFGAVDPAATNLSNVLDEIEQSKGATTFKYLMASLVLTGTILDRGSSPYQDLEMLFKVRNQYMHLPVLKQRDQADLEPLAIMPRWLQTLQGRGLARKSPGVGLTWMAVMQTSEMAEWACLAAYDAMIATLDMLPMGVLAQLGWKGQLFAFLDSTGIDP